MPKILKTTKNPHALTVKQQLVIKDIGKSMKLGTRPNLTESHFKFYNVKKRSTASVMANENIKRPNFKQALLEELGYRDEFDVSEKIARGVSQGLEACILIERGKLVPDYSTRLKYIQEINKILRIY